MTERERKALEADFDYLVKGAGSIKNIHSDHEKLTLYLFRLDGGSSRGIYVIAKDGDDYSLYMYNDNPGFFGNFEFEHMVPDAAKGFHEMIINALKGFPDSIIKVYENPA